MISLTKVSEFRLKLYPKDFERVKMFYQELLGYPVVTEWNHGPEDRGAMFDVGSAIIELLRPQREYLPVQGVSLSLEVRDVVALHHELKNKVELIFGLRHNDWGDTSFCISDPEGLKLTFFTKDPEKG